MNALPNAPLVRVDAHDDGVIAWSTAWVAPSPRLAGFIQGYCDYAERLGCPVVRREVPHGDAVFIVNLDSPITIVGGDGGTIILRPGEAFVAGIHQRPAFSCSGGAQSGIHIRLPLETLRRLLGIPLYELVDRVVPLDAILGSAARPFCEQLLGAPTRDARISALEAALSTRLAGQAAIPSAQAHALKLVRERLDLDLSEIARDIGWSSKHLTGRTRDAIGIGPRGLRRVLRFQRLTQTLRNVVRPDWAMTALDAGYCDRSHMIREFRAFAGIAPRAFMSRSDDAHDVIDA